MSVLKANNISKIYQIGDNKIYALRDVSLQIDQGDFLGIVGKSGSGKSTLMHILGLLDSPTLGELYLEKEKVSDLSENRLAFERNKQIGFVFQTFNLLSRTTALDNVILPMQYSNIPRSEWKDRAIEKLEQVDLGDRLYNKSNELSGGQRQRVAIARALVNEPSIVFADEPTGNLDTRTGEEIENLLIKLNEEGKTIVLVTHDEDLAAITNKKITLKDGEII